MLTKTHISVIFFTVLSLVMPAVGTADQPATGLFAPQAVGVSPGETAELHPQPETAAEALPQNESLNFLVPNPLTPSDTRPDIQAKTVIHFLTGIDMDRIASPVDPAKRFQGVEIPVSILIYEKCTKGTDTQCEWAYSSGFKSSLTSTTTENEHEKVTRTILTETNRDGTWQGQRTILHTVSLENGKPASETYDITYDLGLEPGNAAERESARTREVLHYDYAPTEAKQIKAMTWTKYADTPAGTPREMEYHAVLVYDEHGQPQHGTASKWVSGSKEKTLFDWRSEKDVYDLSARELWQMWEQWIKNGPSHVFIV